MGADIERLPLFLRGGVLIGERGGEAEHAPSKDELYAHSHFGVRIKWNDAAIPLDRNALVDAERRPITAATNVQNATRSTPSIAIGCSSLARESPPLGLAEIGR